MNTSKNLRTIISSFGVPVLFSLALMLGAMLSIAPFFLGVNERFTYGIMGTTMALIIIYIFLKWDRTSFKDYFLTVDKKTLPRYFVGSVMGLVLAATMFLLQSWYSGLAITFTGANWGQFLWMSLSLIPLAFMEES